MNDENARILSHAEGLLRAIEPVELGDGPVYLLDAASAAWFDSSTCIGATHPSFDLLLRPILESQGRWRGRGFACLLDVEWFAANAKPWGWRLKAVCRTTIHELAHRVCFPLSMLDSDVTEAFTVAAMSTDVAVDDVVGHGGTWLRALCHLAWRANATPWPYRLQCKADDLGDHGAYRLSQFRDYADTLRREIVRHHETPLREVLATEPPAAFVELLANESDDSGRVLRRGYPPNSGL